MPYQPGPSAFPSASPLPSQHQINANAPYPPAVPATAPTNTTKMASGMTTSSGPIQHKSIIVPDAKDRTNIAATSIREAPKATPAATTSSSFGTNKDTPEFTQALKELRPPKQSIFWESFKVFGMKEGPNVILFSFRVYMCVWGVVLLLFSYISRAFKQCKNAKHRSVVEAKLRDLIKETMASGTIASKDWDTIALPSIEPGSEAFTAPNSLSTPGDQADWTSNSNQPTKFSLGEPPCILLRKQCEQTKIIDSHSGIGYS